MFFISNKPFPKIVMTLCVKNEADIIAANIEHHIEQGVSRFLITDNASEDNTKEIASKYKEVVDIFESNDPTHFQEKHVTMMAKEACKLNPDWIVHADADEFWVNLRNLAYFDTFSLSIYNILHHMPTEVHQNTTQNWAEYMKWHFEFNEKFNSIINDTLKIAHRPDENILIAHGNHSIININDRRQVATDCIQIHHYSLRNYKQLEFKATKGFDGLASRGQITERWMYWNNLFKTGILFKEFCRISNIFKEIIENKTADDRIWELCEFHTGDEIKGQTIKDMYCDGDAVIKSWKPF